MWDQLEAVGSAESRRISVVLTCFAGGVVFCMPAEHLTGQHTHPEPPTASRAHGMPHESGFFGPRMGPKLNCPEAAVAIL